MRINVYAEELTNEVEIVTKTVTDETFGERTFYGVRFYLASPDVLHHDPEDDDRSAITLWVPWTRRTGHRPAELVELLYAMGDAVRMEVPAGTTEAPLADHEPEEDYS